MSLPSLANLPATLLPAAERAGTARTRQQLRIIWRDLTRRAALAETCRDLSGLADACIDLACEWLHRRVK